MRGELPKERGRCIGMALSNPRWDTWPIGESLWARIAWASGNAKLEILRSLQLEFQGSYSSDSR